MMRLSGSMMATVTLGVLACATPERAAAGALRHELGGYAVEVLVDGAPAPTFNHRGESFVMGALGERYVLRVWNRTGRRVEAVVSVDGRDVVDGRPADFARKRGYLIGPWSFVDIDGWRLSNQSAAAFRFSRVADSYAARTGSPRNVGVIGVALFPERIYQRPRPLITPERHSALPPAGRGAARDKAASEPAPAESRAPSAPSARAEAERPGLGTEFGEQVSSPVQQVSFVRHDPARPAVVLGVRYNDRQGLVAMGVNVDVDPYLGADDSWLRRTADPFPSARGFATPPPGWRGR